MLKKMIAMLLLVAFALQTFSRPFITFNYLVNTKAFAKNCMNKTRPQIHCNGKCQMLKKLRQTEKNEATPDKNPGQKITDLSSRSFFVNTIKAFEKDLFTYFVFNECTTIDSTTYIFRPPSPLL